MISFIVPRYTYNLEHLEQKTQEEIKTGIQAGFRCHFGLSKLVKSRIHSKNLKVQLYGILISSIVMYG